MKKMVFILFMLSIFSCSDNPIEKGCITHGDVYKNVIQSCLSPDKLESGNRWKFLIWNYDLGDKSTACLIDDKVVAYSARAGSIGIALDYSLCSSMTK